MVNMLFSYNLENAQALTQYLCDQNIPDSKVHGANMGPTWVLPAPDGPRVGPINLDIWTSYPCAIPVLLEGTASATRLQWNFLLLWNTLPATGEDIFYGAIN